MLDVIHHWWTSIDLIEVGGITRPLGLAALAALTFLPLEHLFPARRAPGRRAWGADLALATMGQVAVRAAIAGWLGALLAWLDRAAPDRPLFAAVVDRRARWILEVAVGLLLFELGGYLYHRLAHRLPWLWRLHRVHHSSPALDWLAAFRQHPLEILLLTVVQNAPLVLAGVPLGAHATVVALLKLATIYVHANIEIPLGALAQIIATPRFHHRHHQRGGAVRNYASLFPFIDRLFGTHSAERAVAVGLDEPIPETLITLLLAPFARGFVVDSPAAVTRGSPAELLAQSPVIAPASISGGSQGRSGDERIGHGDSNLSSGSGSVIGGAGGGRARGCVGVCPAGPRRR